MEQAVLRYHVFQNLRWSIPPTRATALGTPDQFVGGEWLAG
jgi:hypothetical protein